MIYINQSLEKNILNCSISNDDDDLKIKKIYSNNDYTYTEEGICGSTAVGAVLDLGLLGQIVGRVDGDLHLGGCEESGQVGSVGGDHDQGEEPPHACHHPGRDGPEIGKSNLAHKTNGHGL